MNKKREYDGLAERVKTRREELNWSKSKLANITGLTYHAIRKVELGETVPHEYNLGLIAEALDVTVNYLKYGGDNV